MASKPIWMEEDGFGNIPPVSKYAHERPYDFVVGLIAQKGPRDIAKKLPYWAKSTGGIGAEASYEENKDAPPEERRDAESSNAVESFQERMSETVGSNTREYGLYCVPIFMPRVVLRGKSGNPIVRGANTLSLLVSRKFVDVILDKNFNFEVDASLSSHGYGDVAAAKVEVELTCTFFASLWGYRGSVDSMASYLRLDSSNAKNYKWDPSKTTASITDSFIEGEPPRGIFNVPAIYPKGSPYVLLPYRRSSSTTALYRMRWDNLMYESMFQGPDGPDVLVRWEGDYIPQEHEIRSLLRDSSNGMVMQASEIRKLLPSGESGLYYDDKGRCIGISVNSSVRSVNTNYTMKYPQGLMNPSIRFDSVAESLIVENVSGKECPVEYFKDFMPESEDSEEPSAEGQGVVRIRVNTSGEVVTPQEVTFDVTITLNGEDGWWLASDGIRDRYTVSIPVSNMGATAAEFELYKVEDGEETLVDSIKVSPRTSSSFSIRPIDHGFGDEENPITSVKFKIVTTSLAVGVIDQTSFDGYTRQPLGAGNVPTSGTRKIYSLRKKLAIDDWNGVYQG